MMKPHVTCDLVDVTLDHLCEFSCTLDTFFLLAAQRCHDDPNALIRVRTAHPHDVSRSLNGAQTWHVKVDT